MQMYYIFSAISFNNVVSS